MTQPKDLYKEAKLDQVINSIHVWSLMYIHFDFVTLRDLRILINGFSAVRKMWFWRNHTLISGYSTLKSGYNTLKSGYGYVKKIVKITVICPFPNWLIIWIYDFEVNMMMHLNFCDPAVKFFPDHQKILHWNIELNNLVGVDGWVFPGHPLKFSPFC